MDENNEINIKHLYLYLNIKNEFVEKIKRYNYLVAAQNSYYINLSKENF